MEIREYVKLENLDQLIEREDNVALKKQLVLIKQRHDTKQFIKSVYDYDICRGYVSADSSFSSLPYNYKRFLCCDNCLEVSFQIDLNILALRELGLKHKIKTPNINRACENYTFFQDDYGISREDMNIAFWSLISNEETLVSRYLTDNAPRFVRIREDIDVIRRRDIGLEPEYRDYIKQNSVPPGDMLKYIITYMKKRIIVKLFELFSVNRIRLNAIMDGVYFVDSTYTSGGELRDSLILQKVRCDYIEEHFVLNYDKRLTQFHIQDALVGKYSEYSKSEYRPEEKKDESAVSLASEKIEAPSGRGQVRSELPLNVDIRVSAQARSEPIEIAQESIIAINPQIDMNAPYVEEFITKLLNTTDGLKVKATKRVISDALKKAGLFDNPADGKVERFMLLFSPSKEADGKRATPNTPYKTLPSLFKEYIEFCSENAPIKNIEMFHQELLVRYGDVYHMTKSPRIRDVVIYIKNK